jgi:hypothetical protein
VVFENENRQDIIVYLDGGRMMAARVGTLSLPLLASSGNFPWPASALLPQSRYPSSSARAGELMRYVIDGYNMLHAMGLLQGRTGPHGLEKARRALLGQLHFSCGPEAVHITVVFDAQHAPPHALAEEEYHGIRICYPRDQEADDLIEELVRRDSAPRQLTVVSDDHRVRQAARRRSCPVLACLDYLDSLRRQRRPPPADGPVLEKPDGLSPDEAERWLRELGDPAIDEQLRDALGPSFDEPDPG